VHGADGIDEISTTGYTKVSECRSGTVNTFYVHPSDFGIAKSSPADLKGGDAADNAAIVRSVLDGQKSAARDVVLLNAGAALLIAGRVTTVRDGIGLAASVVDAGTARETLDTMASRSQREAVA
jgi:anthranilate phosphoribosyltransferase